MNTKNFLPDNLQTVWNQAVVDLQRGMYLTSQSKNLTADPAEDPDVTRRRQLRNDAERITHHAEGMAQAVAMLDTDAFEGKDATHFLWKCAEQTS